MRVVRNSQSLCDGKPHIDWARLTDVIDGLQALSDSETDHLTHCKDCLESARVAAREVVRRRRESRREQCNHLPPTIC